MFKFNWIKRISGAYGFIYGNAIRGWDGGGGECVDIADILFQ